MALARSFWIAPLAFLAFIAVSNANGQTNHYFLCYSQSSCRDEASIVTLPECCLENGLTYRGDNEACFECVVYGWNVTQLTVREGTELSVQVVVLKGLNVLVNNFGLTYEVRLAPGGNATEGEDFEFERQTITFDFSTTEYPPISITVPLDGIEREGTETFSLELVRTRGFRESPDSFFNNTLEITIVDGVMVPVLPGCGSSSVLFPPPGDVVPVGCNVCVANSSSVVLSCLVLQGTEPTYSWTGPNGGITSTEPILTGVGIPGQYNCTVTNAEAPDGVHSSSTIILLNPLTVSATINDQSNSNLTDNGCNRFRRSLPDSSNTVCALLGETLFLNCMEEDTVLIDSSGGIVAAAQRRMVTEDLDGETFECRKSDPGRCDTSEIITVRVFKTPLSLRLINSSPRTHGGDISVEFIPSRPLKSAQCLIINLSNFNRSTADCSSGRVRFQNVSSGLYRLRIVAIASTRGKAVERRTVFVCDEEEASCGVTLINEGVTVEGDCATVQFTSCGMVDSFMCRLNRDPFKPCRSPLRFCGLEVLKHRLLIFSFGKQCRKRGRLVANFEVI